MIVELETGKKLTVKGYMMGRSSCIVGEYEGSCADRSFKLSEKGKTWDYVKEASQAEEKVL